MDIIENIKNNFNRGYISKAMKIEGLSDDFPAWTIKQDNYYAVAVPFYTGSAFFEQFSSVCIKSLTKVDIEGESYNMLMLSCSDYSLKDDFSVICSQFVQPGHNGENRYSLLNNPEAWWKNWKQLMGNRSAATEAYPVIGELTVLEYLLKKGVKAEWTGVSSGVHDVQTEGVEYEVKSTSSRYGYEITASNIYQFSSDNNKLFLVFCRFELSPNGRSINDLIKSLSFLGCSADSLNEALENKGLEIGRTARTIKYKLIEMNEYEVDDNFPCVTEHSFKNDRLPAHIVRFNYTIDLSGLPYKNLL